MYFFQRCLYAFLFFFICHLVNVFGGQCAPIRIAVLDTPVNMELPEFKKYAVNLSIPKTQNLFHS